MVVVLDGEVWHGVQNLPGTVDGLVVDGLIRPPVLLLVDSGGRAQRWSDLDAAGGMPDWIADVLLPWAVRELGVSSRPADRVVVGQSLGAAVALLTVAERFDAVGSFLAQSASLWQEGVLERVSAMPVGASGCLEVGRQEWVLLEPNRALHAALLAGGVAHRYVEFNGGHDHACWRGGIADGLLTLLA